MEKLAYEKLMEENNLSLKDLNEDAQIGINTIMDIKKAIRMKEKGGKNISEKVIKKIKANDKWICAEILEIIDGKERNKTDEAPHTAEEIEKDLEKDNVNKNFVENIKKTDEIPVDAVDSIGIEIDSEIENVLKSGRNELSLDELKEICPKSYGIIFENYTPEGENGVITTYYSIIEIGKYKFKLNKK